jgi:hypothetical protein
MGIKSVTLYELFQGETLKTEQTGTKAKEPGAGTVRSNSSEFRDDSFLTFLPFEVELSKLRTDPLIVWFVPAGDSWACCPQNA